jgi:NAD(P)-dependent dehydrogenase (short-subunit alcohol dehydrogenase family)
MLERIFILLFVVFIPALGACADSTTEESQDQQAVLITGASTGIGRAIAEKLASEGYFVYAGARKQSDLDALEAIDNIQAIRIDVTIQEEVDAAVELVSAEGRGLFALINNAGVLITGPSAETDIDDAKWLFEVNVFGVMRMTSAFAPLIIESKGRIIHIGSIAGSVGFNFIGPYSMSKHAIEAYTESLAIEMASLGVGVSVIKPGDYSSEIWKGDKERVRLAKLIEDGSLYVEAYEEWLDFVADLDSKPPGEVADTALMALTDEPMARRYMIVPNDAEMSWVMDNLVDRLADLNRNNVYSWTPEQISTAVGEAIGQKEGE